MCVRERESERQRDRQTDRQTDRQRQTETNTKSKEDSVLVTSPDHFHPKNEVGENN